MPPVNETILLVASPGSTPSGLGALRTARSLAADGANVAVVLLQDAVLTAVAGVEAAPLQEILDAGARVCVLYEDLRMRGFGPATLRKGVQILDYSALVDSLTQGAPSVRGIL